MKTSVKFTLILSVTLVLLGWLAMDGISQAATYYVTLEELQAMPDAAAKRIRVGGDVEPNSIVRHGDRVEFVIIQTPEEGGESRRLNVVYTGHDPLPDTFRDNAQALCDGRLLENGTFEAKRIQAKCASKYEEKPGEAAPVYDSKPVSAT